MSATDSRAGSSAVFILARRSRRRRGILRATELGTGGNQGEFWTKTVSRHPGDRPLGQDFSLFINTLKLNLSGIILAFGGISAPSWRWGQGAFLIWWQPEPFR
jgi:hypothetical protein